MLVQTDTRSGVPLYRQIMDQVTRMIVAGELAEGEQLESVAGLASRLKINPMTISKAYGFLVEAGLVERRPGVGLFVLALDERHKQQVRHKLLVDSLGQSAALAVQLGVDVKAATELFLAEYERLQSELEAEAG